MSHYTAGIDLDVVIASAMHTRIERNFRAISRYIILDLQKLIGVLYK